MSSSVLPDFSLGDNVSECDIFALKFHPSEQILLAGDVGGRMHFCMLDVDAKSVSLPECAPYRPHKTGSVRSIDFVGSNYVSGGSDCRVVVSNFDPAKVSGWNLGTPISVVRAITESLVLAGDDDGVLHGIDLRQKKKIYSISEQSDFITSIEIANTESPLKTVVATAGDSTLAVYDLRVVPGSSKRKQESLVAMSDEQENEINCAILMNCEAHLLTGDAGGVVGIWKQGFWGDVKDRLPLYPKADGASGKDGAHAIEGMKKVAEDKFVTATSDGIIRLCTLFPNQVDRIIGVHRTGDNGEIANVSGFDCDVDLGIVATGDDSGVIKFWSVQGGRAPEEENEKKIEKPKKSKKRPTTNYNPDKANRQTFFQSL